MRAAVDRRNEKGVSNRAQWQVESRLSKRMDHAVTCRTGGPRGEEVDKGE